MNKYKITDTENFRANQEKAVELMNEKGVNAVEIPNGYGFILAKPDSPEGKERQAKKLCPFTTKIDGKEYLICRS